MKFADKLKNLRKQAGMTQEEVAKAIGVGRRTYISYEKDGRYPRYKHIYEKLADLFSCDVDYLLTDKENFIIEAADNYGHSGLRQATELVAELSIMFAGGDLSANDKDAVFHALEKAYYICKEDNKKYTPKKYLKNDGNSTDDN